MSAVTDIKKAIKDLQSGDVSFGSRESKAIWYLRQASVCLTDEEEVSDPTEEQAQEPAEPAMGGHGEPEAPAATPPPVTTSAKKG